jgi:hypothetical protein
LHRQVCLYMRWDTSSLNDTTLDVYFLFKSSDCLVLIGNNRLKVRMRHRFTRGQSVEVIVPQQFVEEINRFRRNVSFVFSCHELGPCFAGEPGLV